MPFHLLEKLHQESFSILYFFFSPSHLEGNADGNTICARIYARGEVSFAKFLFLPSFYFCQTVGGQFFSFCQN
jgi:hypothetical protein